MTDVAGPHQTQPEAIADHFRSVDSAPAGISVNRPASASNGFLITFTGLSIIALCISTYLVGTGLAERYDLVVLAKNRGTGGLPTRTFVIVFFVTYAAYAYTNVWRRVAIGLSLLGKFAVVSVAFDGIGWALDHLDVINIPVGVQSFGSALVALAIFPHTILRHAKLPHRDQRAPSPVVPASAYVKLFVCLTVAIVVAVFVARVFFTAVFDMKQIALLGGVGPGAFLFQQVFAITTAGFGWLVIRRSRRAKFTPPLAILVPAHDEAHDIAATIESVDRAAVSYPGPIHLCVVDNASTDETTEVAERAIADCTEITGEVIQCPTPGKAIALNQGIAHLPQEFVVRIDADSVIAPGCLQTAMSHFANPRVGSVGGLPLPAEEKTWIDKVRLVEVYLRHGFFQVSLDGYQGVLGVPGMFAIYRRSAVLEVGGMVQGMNGEDTDICIRLDGAGYHTVADPKAVYYSETPATYAHLREQRTRWFRSIYHLAAHNRGTLLRWGSMTGLFVLPFQLVNAARRAMLAPILIFALIAVAGFRATFSGLQWQPEIATVLGMPLIMTVFVLLLWRPGAIRYVPAYLLFRLLRSYFTLGSALSLRFPPLNPHLPRRRK
ncbi:glycosyltransferase [Speluncibacter jeojiensis]|uniref:Glycosyltransferase family 2 protein n=1 Tax=Speluncibacter jeojiensis TaxID=2710754 RepID=A0A9X4M400_9ACTN|nr:glycosyltransferase family 2 protein [Corynebacteriales bacterium D3-21]